VRTVECAQPPVAIHSSTWPGVHDHGQPPVNAANRRTVRSREPIIDSLNRLDNCCDRHPSSIASNTAGSRRTGVRPVTNVNVAEPAARAPDIKPPEFHHAIRRHNQASNATAPDASS
jgi:hypothetical protein